MTDERDLPDLAPASTPVPIPVRLESHEPSSLPLQPSHRSSTPPFLVSALSSSAPNDPPVEFESRQVAEHRKLMKALLDSYISKKQQQHVHHAQPSPPAARKKSDNVSNRSRRSSVIPSSLAPASDHSAVVPNVDLGVDHVYADELSGEEDEAGEWGGAVGDSTDESDPDGDVDTSGDESEGSYKAPGDAQSRSRSSSSRQHVETFLVLLAESLQEYGCPTGPLENHMNEVAAGLGHPARFSIFNGFGFASWMDEVLGGGQTLLFGSFSGMDVFKLQCVDELARRIASYSRPGPPIQVDISLVEARMASAVELAGAGLVKRERRGGRWRTVWDAVKPYLRGTLWTAKGTALAGDDIARVMKKRAKKIKRHHAPPPATERAEANDEKDKKASMILPVQAKDSQTTMEEIVIDARTAPPSPGIPRITVHDAGGYPMERTDSMLRLEILNLASLGPGFFPPAPAGLNKRKKRGAGTASLKSSLVGELDSDLGGLRRRRQNTAASVLVAEEKSTEPEVAPVTTKEILPRPEEAADAEAEELPGAADYAQAFSEIAVSDALRRLKEIRKLPPLYPGWMSVLVYGAVSAGCAGLFFSGGWWDVLISFILGCAVGGLAKITTGQESAKLFEFLAALMVGFLGRLIVAWNVPICFTSGTNITLSVVELASRHMTAGMSRLGHSLTVTALIGLGLDFGSNVASSIMSAPTLDPLTSGAGNCNSPLSTQAVWAIFAPTVFVFIVDLNSHPRQFIFMASVATVAQVIYVLAYPRFNDPLASAMASFSMGLFSYAYSRVGGANSMGGILSGLQILVPGTLAVRAFDAEDIVSGLGLAASVLVVALSLGLGLFLAGMIMAPLGRLKYGRRRGILAGGAQHVVGDVIAADGRGTRKTRIVLPPMSL
ncbi:hypothetical protein HK101_008529 [Irineochytrium annulatum]|nr:hypothetical protein HK101_008529 [Irineochytrium annulatum]